MGCREIPEQQVKPDDMFIIHALNDLWNVETACLLRGRPKIVYHANIHGELLLAENIS